ncbi:MAG: SAM-dependent methyltransferase [Robiginitomaculum sp.]|nr:MAG: SAM-dependent methyltransferase [Robiginitomaculum sp.]
MQYSTQLKDKIAAIYAHSQSIGFDMQCDHEVANLCAVLAGQNQHLLELGTGTGLSTLFITTGKSPNAVFDTVDISQEYSTIAQKIIGKKDNVNFIVEDAGKFLARSQNLSYDFIFADAWPGKYSHLDHALRVLKQNGIYIIDDLLPQSNWPKNHQFRVDALLHFFQDSPDFSISYLNWATGIALITKITTATQIAISYKNHPEYGFLFSQIALT